eukprot:COSAG02_NODE_776_length_17302_cov_17.765855_6_plen_245_part_00
MLDREAESKEAEADLVLQQVTQESAESQQHGSASWRDRQTRSARGSSRQPFGTTATPHPPVKRGISGTFPRVEADGSASKTPRPLSRESGGSSPRSSHGQNGAATHAVSKVVPANLEALNSLQRLGVRTNSQDSPRARDDDRGPKAGSEWIQESVNQLKQFAEVNKSITRLWKTAVKVDLVSLPPDPRLHSTIGRRSYEAERRAWLHEQETGKHAVGEGDHTVGVAIHQFAGLFAADRTADESP